MPARSVIDCVIPYLQRRIFASEPERRLGSTGAMGQKYLWTVKVTWPR